VGHSRQYQDSLRDMGDSIKLSVNLEMVDSIKTCQQIGIVSIKNNNKTLKRTVTQFTVLKQQRISDYIVLVCDNWVFYTLLRETVSNGRNNELFEIMNLFQLWRYKNVIKHLVAFYWNYSVYDVYTIR